jgi:hypothetical protein
VVDGSIGEEPARRETGMAGPDDDGCDALDVSSPRDYATSTVTFTGLVMMS